MFLNAKILSFIKGLIGDIHKTLFVHSQSNLAGTSDHQNPIGESNSSSTFSASNSKDPEVSLDAKMDEYKLEERPITIRDELMLGSEDGPKDETPEKREARLQSVVDTYNNQLVENRMR